MKFSFISRWPMLHHPCSGGPDGVPDTPAPSYRSPLPYARRHKETALKKLNENRCGEKRVFDLTAEFINFAVLFGRSPLGFSGRVKT
ncbi:MAG: hypothetical protein IJ584_06690, partial [Bacteroidales bacterium]|nr:hypothetical protein [Bacteroidales bacterium]